MGGNGWVVEVTFPASDYLPLAKLGVSTFLHFCFFQTGPSDLSRCVGIAEISLGAFLLKKITSRRRFSVQALLICFCGSLVLDDCFRNRSTRFLLRFSSLARSSNLIPVSQSLHPKS